MLYSNDRRQMRRIFLEAWRKLNANEALEPMEGMIAAAIKAHPEYAREFADFDAALTRDYAPEAGFVNPFLHLSMHITIQEQVTSDQPRGLQKIFNKLAHRLGDAHEAEHRMAECLADTIWTMQRNNLPFDETRYLDCLRKIR